MENRNNPAQAGRPRARRAPQQRARLTPPPEHLTQPDPGPLQPEAPPAEPGPSGSDLLLPIRPPEQRAKDFLTEWMRHFSRA